MSFIDSIKNFFTSENKTFLNRDSLKQRVFPMINYDDTTIDVKIWIGQIEKSSDYGIVLIANDVDAHQKTRVYNSKANAFKVYNSFVDGMRINDAINKLTNMCDRCIYKDT